MGRTHAPYPKIIETNAIEKPLPGYLPPTTNIYNDYVGSLSRLARVGGRAVGLTYSDNALMTREIRLFAPPWSSMR